MSRLSTHRRRGPGVTLAALALLPLLAACGDSLTRRVTRGMDGCIAQRNPLFVAGRGAEAIQLPLTPEVEALASRFNYEAAFRAIKPVAKTAGTQAALTCALEFAARYRDDAAKTFLATYAQHPSPDVAAAARRLLATFP
ncbi:MAG: hypothetical protein HY275_01935 [Gemmatimonadetes bacterium]|nr:hypothetical protein [Gemmatimonadota bacterium]